ncbi:sugar transporter ERD6-like 5 isoform X1 [Senna tora]|uniref:Sugar transporter ERD6-like 5 isoform X1 n=1 Tax=Senna tora TaxID=362788 RepID=A0A834SJ45_9FABA|nr:sugar transporter ERD6-like 5 isoform X1 [Senna tora]
MENRIREASEFSSALLLKDESKKQSNGGVYPATPILILTTIVAVCGSYVFGSAIGYSSPAQSGITHDLNLGVPEYSFFGSILTIGAVIGAIGSGKVADYAGRRGAMGFSQIFCILGWLAIAFSKVAWWLYIGRLLVGCGMGLLSYVVPVYVAEITPKNLRGGFSAVHQLMICCGVSFTYLFGAILNWRILALIGTIPCIVQLLGLYFIPESPRWLASNGRLEESESILQHLRGKNADVSFEATEIRDYIETLHGVTEASIIDLFQRQYIKSLTVGVGLMILQQFGGVNGISFYASSIFVSAGFSGSVGTIAMVVVQIPMTALGVVLMDKSGRRPLLLVSAGGTCLGCFLVGLSFFLQELQRWKEFTPFLALVGVLVFTGSFSLGMGAIPWLIMSEIFPINVKGSAGSLVTVVSWLGSWIELSSYSVPYVASLWSRSCVTVVDGGSEHPVHKTLASAGNLANLLPTSTVLAFNAVIPCFSSDGSCQFSNKLLILCLILVCCLFCFFSSFTDSFTGTDGKLYYGIATFRGLYIFNYYTHYHHILPDPNKYKICFLDFLHAFLSLFLFFIFAITHSHVQTCFMPLPHNNMTPFILNLPLPAALLSTFLFTIFPTTRRGIGYSH